LAKKKKKGKNMVGNGKTSLVVVGIIGIDYKGVVSGIFNTEAMPWGYIRSDGKIFIKGLP
jgi:hypothetical protein